MSAIEAVAATAVKEVAVQAAREAATQAAREIVQKMAAEAGAQGAGNEMQTVMIERQTMQEGFRVGEMPETKGDGREMLRQKESDAAEELRGKFEREETQPEENGSATETESTEVQSAVETDVQSAETAKEAMESQKVVESTELAEAQEGTTSAELEQLKAEYADDLVARSEYPDTIDKEQVTEASFEKISPDECVTKRNEFNQGKSELISQWEKENRTEWPRYKEDVFNENGNKIRRAGDLYDCHHIQPLTHGGKNEAGNVTPMHALEHYDHQGIHAFNSPYSRMDNLLKLKEVA